LYIILFSKGGLGATSKHLINFSEQSTSASGAEQSCEDGAGQEVGSCLIPGPKLAQKTLTANGFSGASFLI
jgi:hypothetical protein